MKNFKLLNKLGCVLVSNLPKFVVKKTDKFETFLLTEFNWGWNPISIDENYLDERFVIFDKYTYPSINSQTDKNFTWILFLNDKTPQKYIGMLDNYKKNASINLILEYVSGNNLCVQNIITKYSKLNTKYLLTARCDNDDMLAINYIEKLKENFRPVDKMFIDFIQGYCLYHEDKTLNNYKSRSNHFIGYVDKIESDKKINTVFCCNHAFARDNGFLRQVNNKKYPLWCEVIHDTNQINYFQGDLANQKEFNYFINNFVYKK